MEQVVQLLKDLSAKVTAEGKEDAASYDKYACFCKEQASDKLYAIEESKDKIADLKAQIEKLDSDIAQLNEDIKKLSKKISELEKEIDEKTKIREKEHAVYLAKAQDLNEAISACARAIEALEESKAEIAVNDGKTSSLMQITQGVVAAVSKQPMLAHNAHAVALLSKINEPGQPAKFQYQSNDIIATLQDLLADFKKMKKDLDDDEFEVNAAFESEVLGLTNEKTFAEKEKAEKEAIEQAKQEEKEEAETDKDQEEKDMKADEEFMAVLTSDCEEKAKLFDQRSETRAGELKALSEATQALEEGAVPNWSANKKLVGFTQKGVVLGKGAKVSAASVAFVQIESVQHQRSSEQAVVKRVQSFLDETVERTGSRVLSALALRVKVAEDHFVKVRGLIKDLIMKLEADAKAEAEQKSVCDKGMAKAINKRDKANANIEAANAKITKETARKEAMEAEIDELNKKIAELKKALLEATELRAEEKAENEKTIAMAEEGAQATKTALEILQTFYENAFVQKGKYVPPNSDRDGNTVGDLAPETFGDKYHGAQNESKGIIGILEVILSDFERTVEKTKEEEAESQAAFEEFEKATNDEIDEKNKRIEFCEGELKDAKEQILSAQEDLKEATELLDSALESLEKLEAMCVKGEETWEERKKARMEEIEALKEALAILEDWQS